MAEEAAVNLLDLPDEILIMIIKKLRAAEILYSFFGVNQRLHHLARSLTGTKYLDLLSISTNERCCIADFRPLPRFHHHILPEIHQNLEVLIVDQLWLINILLAGEYPHLRMISIRNCCPWWLTDDLKKHSSIARLFNNQITHVTMINDKTLSSRISFTYGCDAILSACSKLDFFDCRRRCKIKCTELSFVYRPSTISFSSQLRTLFVNVFEFDVCLYLLDGRLEQLTFFTVNVRHIHSTLFNGDHRRVISSVKEFSLTSYSLTSAYDSRIIPLVRRMINLESLSLFLNIKRSRFLSRTHFEDRIVRRLLKLNSFNFHISTTISIYGTTHLLAAKDVEMTFHDWKYSPVHCSMYYFANQLGVAYLSSTAVKATSLKFIADRFRRPPFRFVTDLRLYGTSAWAHDYFQWIARAFPLLKYFTLNNETPQENQRPTITVREKSIIRYARLIALNLTNAHMDYVRQFLWHTKAYLPKLDILMIHYDQLVTVTENFTGDSTRINCAQVKRLMIHESIDYSPQLLLYFPLCEKLSS